MPPSAEVLLVRRQRVVEALRLENAVLVVGAGEPIPLPEGSDQTYPYRSHADYVYLSGQECSGGIIAFDPQAPAEEQWISFVPEVTEAERVWQGRQQAPGTPVTEFGPWLRRRARRPVVLLGAPVPGVSFDRPGSAAARELFLHARRPKDSDELDRVRRAVDATAEGFAWLEENVRPGVTERALQIGLESAFLRAGADRTGYGTIVGSGPNAAVLHFEPSGRAVRAGEFVLVDAGAEVERYTADVTRTFVAGALSAFQRDIYQLVLATEERAIARCRAGTEWKAIHLAAAVDIAAGLVDLGVLRGTPESLVEREAHTLFFPHGIGHMVGLGVRDASGLLPDRTRDPRPSLRTLRMDLPLAAGYLVTIEPGIYFIPALLNDPARRARFTGDVGWSLVDQHLGIGGVRIEDNILVTAGEPEIMTRDIPKPALPPGH